tara:strand:- start:139 stop:336 length:198 start_codon:yes stop_codon:yes gene_type:complete
VCHDSQPAVDAVDLRSVVREAEHLSLHALALIVLELQTTDGVDEMLLQLLVGVVDAQLLEGVDLQ